MQATLVHILDRSSWLRRQIEREQRQPVARASRLLRLQALMLRTQRRLAELTKAASVGPAPLVASPSRR